VCVQVSESATARAAALQLELEAEEGRLKASLLEASVLQQRVGEKEACLEAAADVVASLRLHISSVEGDLEAALGMAGTLQQELKGRDSTLGVVGGERDAAEARAAALAEVRGPASPVCGS
jgi:chromosome segregation ATPase